MGAHLLETWLGDGERVDVFDAASVSQVREAVRQAAAGRGLPAGRREGLVTAASELAWNQVRHARGGSVAIRPVARGGVPGLEVIAADRGGGLADPRAALADRAPGEGSLGAGLGAVLRMTDEVDVDVRLGEGTCVRARSFAAPVPRREVAILGRPHRHERVSGDQALCLASDERLLLLVADGLGHGPEARAAADRAVDAVAAEPGGDPVRLLERCDAAVSGSRGAAVTIVAVDFAGRLVCHAGAGNVGARLYEGRSGHRFLPTARVVGQPAARSTRQLEETRSLGSSQLLVLFSDGLSSRFDLGEELELRRGPLVLVAQALLERHGQTTDDALVLLARWT